MENHIYTTPIKQRLRRSGISQTEKKTKKVKTRRLSARETPRNLAIGSSMKVKLKKQPSPLHNIKLSSQCFVNIERLRLSKLDLEEIPCSPSLHSENDITDQEIEECTNVQFGESGKYVIHPRFVTNNISEIKNDSDVKKSVEPSIIAEDNIENNVNDESSETTLNNTYTLSASEENLASVLDTIQEIRDNEKQDSIENNDKLNLICTKDIAMNSLYFKDDINMQTIDSPKGERRKWLKNYETPRKFCDEKPKWLKDKDIEIDESRVGSNNRSLDEVDLNKESTNQIKCSDVFDRRRTFDKTETNKNDSSNEQNSFYNNDSMETSIRNFSNVTLRKHKTNENEVTDDNLYDSVQHLSVNNRRATFDKTKTDVNKQNIEEDSHKKKSFSICNSDENSIEGFDKNLLEKQSQCEDKTLLFLHKNDTIMAGDNTESNEQNSFYNNDSMETSIRNFSNANDNLYDSVQHLSVNNRRATFDKTKTNIINDVIKQNIEDDSHKKKSFSICNSDENSIECFDKNLLEKQTECEGKTLLLLHKNDTIMAGDNIESSLINLRTSDKEDIKLSIMKKLSKPKMLKSKLRKVTNKIISRDSHSISWTRTPRLSGSKSVQLFEALSDKKFEAKTPLPLLSDNARNLSILEETPPSGSSTPKILKKHVINSLLKSTLKKQNNDVLHNTINNTSKKFALGKVPNFALIHKKQFDKMENISDYKERKSERAKLLLSGTKLHNSTLISSVNQKIVKPLLMNSLDKTKTNMVLTNDSNDVSSASVDNKENVKDLESFELVKTKKRVTVNVSPEILTPKAKSFRKIRKTPYKINSQCTTLTDETDSLNTINSNLPQSKIKCHISSPRPEHSNSNATRNNKGKLINTKNLQKMSKTNSSSDALTKTRQLKTSAGNSSSKQSIAANLKSGLTKSSVQCLKEKKGYTRFGFTVPVKPKKDDIVKAVMNKSRIPKNDQKEEKRTVIRGVRSNRRFDLLMEMRNKEK